MKEKEKRKLRLGIYVRVSTDEQAQEGFSIRAQIDKLKTYALLKGWEIYDIYVDEGISGKNIVDRPAINRLIDDINDDKVNNVLVFKVDRLTRSTKNLLELVELFEEKDCAFNSLTESIDTDTPSGRMFLKIIGIFAEFERENLVSRLKMGFERKAKEGYTLANRSMSYGYSKEKGQKVQTIIPHEAKIVKEIYEMYVNRNKSMTGIAKNLNQRKISTKMNAASWDTATIKLVLTNPTYIGKVRYSTTDESKYFEAEGHHERILPDELFYLAQEKIKMMPRVSRTKRPRENNYFCGVLTCECCGSKFTTHNYTKAAGNDKCMYICIKKSYHKRKEDNCDSLRISHDKVETAFIEYIRGLNDFSEIDSLEFDNDNAKKERELLEYAGECERKLEALYARKKAIMEQYVNEEISFAEYRNLLSTVEEKLEAMSGELQKAKAELPSESEVPDIDKNDIIANIKENWDYLNNAERMMFLQRFVKRMVIRVEKEKARSNIVKIEKIEFRSVSQPLIEKHKKTVVRSNLRSVR